MIARLLKRRDFLAVANGVSVAVPSLVAQMTKRPHEASVARLGFTCTKKLGNAVVRNRIRRRLKEAARISAALHLRPGHDYVFIGRHAALQRGFEELQKDIISALEKIHAPHLKPGLKPRRPSLRKPEISKHHAEQQ